MIRVRLRITLCTAALAVFGARAHAQNCTTAAGTTVQCAVAARTFQFTTKRTINLVVTPTTVSFLDPTASDYNQGFTLSSSSQDFTVNANSDWTLTIRSNKASFTEVGVGARAAKPRTDLEWATSLGGPYTAMPGINAASALQFGSGTATTSTTVSMFYRVLWTWDLDTPGTYTLPLIILLTAP